MSENILDYVNYNFDDLVIQLTNRVKLNGVWTDTYRSSEGQMLIELYGYVGNLVLYQLERTAEEVCLGLARRKSSVLEDVKILNYTPKRKTSAIGPLNFSITEAHDKRIFISKYTECQTPSGIKYLVSEDVVLPIGSTSISASAIQGYIVEQEFVSTGDSNQSFDIGDISIENSNVFVYVDGEEWEVVSTFAYSSSTSKVVMTKQTVNDRVLLTFGDGVFGKIPNEGYTILVKSVISEGLAGNVYGTDLITTINSTIYDSAGVAMDLIVTNDEAFLGGDDEEDIEEIRREAPLVFKTGDRFVNKDDYIVGLENYSGIANANVWGEKEEGAPDYNMFNRVNITVLMQNWQLPTDTLKQALTTYLYEKGLMTVKFEFIDPEIINVVINEDIYAVKGSNLSYAQSNVETIIENQFILGDTVRLGTAKRYSDLVAVVDGVSNVSYHYMTTEIYKIVSPGYDSNYNYGTTLPLTDVKPGTIRVFVGTVEVGADDGLGNISGVGSDYTLAGIVDYETGYVGIDFSDPVGQIVSIKYQQDENGDLVVGFNQICKLYETNIIGLQYVS